MRKTSVFPTIISLRKDCYGTPESSSFSKKVGEHQVLKDISLEVEEHELVSLLGVSGSGKTTLFNLISGLLPPDEGPDLYKWRRNNRNPRKDQLHAAEGSSASLRTIEDNVCPSAFAKRREEKSGREKVRPYFAPFGLAGTEKKISPPAFRRYAPESRTSPNVPVLPGTGSSRRTIFRPGHHHQEQYAPLVPEE